MMKSVILKVCVAVFAAGIVGTAAGCSGGNNTSSSATVPTTQKPTVQATTTPSATTANGAQDEDENNEQQDTAAAQSGTEAGADADGFISREDAAAKVKQQIGTAGQIIDMTLGTSPDGAKAWVVTASVAGREDAPSTVVYYVGYQFCYTDSYNTVDGDEEAGDGSANVGVDRATAINNVKKQAGTGAEIISCYAGTSPEGLPAWIITVAPVTADVNAVAVTYYSGYQFCYPAS